MHWPSTEGRRGESAEWVTRTRRSGPIDVRGALTIIDGLCFRTWLSGEGGGARGGPRREILGGAASARGAQPVLRHESGRTARFPCRRGAFAVRIGLRCHTEFWRPWRTGLVYVRQLIRFAAWARTSAKERASSVGATFPTLGGRGRRPLIRPWRAACDGMNTNMKKDTNMKRAWKSSGPFIFAARSSLRSTPRVLAARASASPTIATCGTSPSG